MPTGRLVLDKRSVTIPEDKSIAVPCDKPSQGAAIGLRRVLR